MAIFHCSIKIISRSSGKSAVAAAAYRSGEKLEDQEKGLVFDYTKKGGVIFNEILLPQNAPKEYYDRETLWNAVQKIEKRSDAQLAREIEVSLPAELSREQQFNVVRSYVMNNFVSKGMGVDWALHDKGDGNPHAHIMLTTRGFNENGTWAAKEKTVFKLDESGEKIPIIDPKTGKQKVIRREGKGEEKRWVRETVLANTWNDPGNAEIWREAWAHECNKYLDAEHQIDHRSFARQGIELEPTIHEGYAAREMERCGRISELCQENRDIRARNARRLQLRERLSENSFELAKLFREKKATFKIKVNPLTEPIGEALAAELNMTKEREKKELSLNAADPIVEELPAVYDSPRAENIKLARTGGDPWWSKEYKDARKYLYGTKDTDPQLEKAFALLRGEARKGNGLASYDFGKMYLSGLGCKKNAELAQKWFAKAYDAFYARQSHVEKPDYLQYRIGKLYALGHGVEQNYSQAVAWYERAIKAGSPFAAYSLGSLYRRGLGVDRNDARAAALYQVAATSKRPNAYAAYELGRMSSAGEGLPKDDAAADRWYRQAYQGFLSIEQKSSADDKLFYRLGRMNLDGIGTEIDLEKAKTYLEKAEALENVNAAYGLGRLHLMTEFEEYNPQIAEEYLWKAANADHEYAQYLLGKLYMQGDELPLDEEAAMHWLEKAANKGNHMAEYQLGKLYLFGENPDYEKGIAYLTAAAEHGDEYAAKLLQSRKVTLAKIHALGDSLLTIRREGLDQAEDIGKRIDQLKDHAAEAKKSLLALQEKHELYSQVRQQLLNWRAGLPIAQERDKLRGSKKEKFVAMHAGELAKFDQAERQLQALAVSTSADPNKVQGLLQDQAVQIAALNDNLNRVTTRIDQLQKTEALIWSLQNDSREPAQVSLIGGLDRSSGKSLKDRIAAAEKEAARRNAQKKNDRPEQIRAAEEPNQDKGER